MQYTKPEGAERRPLDPQEEARIRKISAAVANTIGALQASFGLDTLDTEAGIASPVDTAPAPQQQDASIHHFPIENVVEAPDRWIEPAA